MNVFNQVKRSARRAGFEAERVVRIERVQAQIAALNGQLRAGITQVGHRAYDLVQRGDVTHPELQQLCTHLDALRAQITAHEAEIETIRNEDFIDAEGSAPCVACGAECTATTLFCPRCGTPRQPSIPAAGPTGGTVCMHCAAKNARGTLFCVQCGHALSGQTLPLLSRSSPRRTIADVGITPPSPLQTRTTGGA